MDSLMPKETPESKAKKDALINSLVGKTLVPKGSDKVDGIDKSKAVFESQLEGPYRVLKPGSMMTMDLRTNRLNLSVDENSVITKCGYF